MGVFQFSTYFIDLVAYYHCFTVKNVCGELPAVLQGCLEFDFAPPLNAQKLSIRFITATSGSSPAKSSMAL
jgi:hypothetical protein